MENRKKSGQMMLVMGMVRKEDEEVTGEDGLQRYFEDFCDLFGLREGGWRIGRKVDR